MESVEELKLEISRLHSVNAELVTELQKALDSLEYVQQTFPGTSG
jgi:hypothetical protein